MECSISRLISSLNIIMSWAAVQACGAGFPACR
jgi:hypothetical protein